MPKRKTNRDQKWNKRNLVTSVFSNKLNLALISFLILITAIGLYVRLKPAITGLTHFSFDQGLDQILVKKVAVDHDISLISRYTGLDGVFMGPYYTWFMTVPFLISSGNPSANVIYFGILNVLAAIITALLFRKMVSTEVGVITLILMLVSPVFISGSHIVISPNPIIFFSGVTVFFTWLITYKKQDHWLPLLALGLSAWFQLEIGYALFALVVTGVTIWYYRRFTFIHAKSFMLAIIAFVIPFIPQIVFDFRNGHIISSSLWKYMFSDSSSLGATLTIPQRIINRFRVFYDDIVFNLGFGSGIVMATINVGIIVWARNRLKKTTQLGIKHVFNMSLILLFGFYASLFLYKGYVWSWYRVGMPVLFILILAIALAEFFKVSGLHKKIVVLWIVVLCVLGLRIDKLFASEEPGKGIAVMQNQTDTLDFLYQQADGEPFGLYVYTAPIYTWIWDYQLWWYAQPTYGYLPHPYDIHLQNGNPEKVYLLLEEPEYKSFLVGWRDNFTHYGEMIDAWDLETGVRVEEWRFESEPEGAVPLGKFVEVF